MGPVGHVGPISWNEASGGSSHDGRIRGGHNHGDRTKSPRWGCGTPSKWHKWLINGGY